MSRFALLLILLPLVAAAIFLTCLQALIAPRQSAIGRPPADLQAESVSFLSKSGSRIAGWFVESKPGNGAVLLLHGVRANRSSEIERMRLFKEDGYSVLAIDLQAHGESNGTFITFGYLESQDAAAAVTWLRARLPQDRVGVAGTSLGGAAAILARETLKADALVLEAVYADIVTAAENRLGAYLGRAGVAMARPLIAISGMRLGIDARELRPVDAIRHNTAPKYFIYGGSDDRATPEEGRAIFAAAAEPKDFWLVEGARHVDFYHFSPDAYRERILPFLRRWLRNERREFNANPSSSY